MSAGGTQELDASDILEVKDLASAIARAEEIIRLPQPRDMFDVLANAKGAKTDDCIGPALPAPYGMPITPITPITPAPPPPPPAQSRPQPTRAPAASQPQVIVVAEEDAYYHPGGNIRTLADVTLDGYRPEPTFQIKLRARRHSLGWIVGAVLGPLALLIALSIFFRTTSSSASPPVASGPAPTQTSTSAPVVTAAPPPAPTPTVTPEPADTVPSMDVKKLPPARTARPAAPRRR